MPNQTKTLSGISLIALLLALTACGDDDNSEADGGGDDTIAEENGDSTDAEEIFDFTTGFHEPVTGPYEEVLIEIPSDLLQEDDAYREDRVLDAAIIRAAEHEASQCAVEVEFIFADGVQDDIENQDWHDETARLYDEETESVDVQYEDVSAEARYNELTGIAGQRSEYSNAVEDDRDREVDFAEDYSSAVVPLDCAANSADDSDVVGLTFEQIDEWVAGEYREVDRDPDNIQEGEEPVYAEEFHTGGPRHDTFAEADLNVDSEGQLHIVRSHVEGWQLDANENWITN